MTTSVCVQPRPAPPQFVVSTTRTLRPWARSELLWAHTSFQSSSGMLPTRLGKARIPFTSQVPCVFSAFLAYFLLPQINQVSLSLDDNRKRIELTLSRIQSPRKIPDSVPSWPRVATTSRLWARSVMPTKSPSSKLTGPLLPFVYLCYPSLHASELCWLH